ncbi:MAG TPA: S8 family serine peptidase [Pseudonocardiaceae bacterium]|nr:S8 family serine peptidase [Pseudonocardiaceae bacterium]
MTPLAYADTGQPATTPAAASASCVQGGPTLRYLVVFNPGTSAASADQQITGDCGITTVYYPQIAVAVATSSDPTFNARIGPTRAYSAQAEAYNDTDTSPGTEHKADELPGSDAVGNTTDPTSVASANHTSQQWDMDLIHAQQAHRINEGSSNVVVGVLDSGIDANHPQLTKELDPQASAGCLTGKPDTTPAAWEPTSSAHGTHVAGIIAAADDGTGVAGVAPGVRVASVKVVNDEGYIYPEAAVCGFMWAAAQGMAVTNSSYYIDPWVFTCKNTPGQNVIYEAVRRAVAYASSRGVLNVAAAGNQGVDLTDPGQDNQSPDNVDPGDRDQRALGEDCSMLPAGLPGVVTVSAVGAQDLKAGYSSYGLGAIDVTAPGGDPLQRNASGQSCVESTVPDGYAGSCGTSMATPHVSGVVALLASTHPHSSPRTLTRLLAGQAQAVSCPADYDLNGSGVQDAYCTGSVSYNSFYGHGMVDALAAVTENLPTAPSSPSTQSGTGSGTTSPVAAQLGSPVTPTVDAAPSTTPTPAPTPGPTPTGTSAPSTSTPDSSQDGTTTPDPSTTEPATTEGADQRTLTLIGPW